MIFMIQSVWVKLFKKIWEKIARQELVSSEHLVVIDWLRAKGKSWEQITESASRSAGKDLGF
jgi:N-glycosylase/DNA lyase